MSSGPGSSGKPWPRLMALLSRASCDIASKMVTGRSAKTLFIELIERSAAGSGRQSCSLPAQHASRKMLVVSQTCGLRRQRSRHRALARTAGENNLPALRVRNGLRVEARKRNDDAAWIGFRGHFIRLADIDEQIASLLHALRYVLRC